MVFIYMWGCAGGLQLKFSGNQIFFPVHESTHRADSLLILFFFHLKQNIGIFFLFQNWFSFFTENTRYFTLKCTGTAYGNKSFASRLQFYRLQCLVLNILFKTKGKDKSSTELYCYDHFALLRPVTVWLE